MTRLHWILLALVLATWIPAYLWFFHGDLSRWWRERGPKRAEARLARAAYEAEQARLREELAAKYLSPESGAGPRA